MQPRQKSSTTIKRSAEDRAARRDRGDRERQHRDRVHETEGEDREPDRVEAEPDAAESPQRRDLDDVVEPERQHDPARGRGTAGREAAAAIGPLAREQALPAERTQEEAGEIGGRGRRARDRRSPPPAASWRWSSVAPARKRGSDHAQAECDARPDSERGAARVV